MSRLDVKVLLLVVLLTLVVGLLLGPTVAVVFLLACAVLGTVR